ncbi:MAG: beta-phosphoglucomutase [Tenericutes bacterium HGW-Tenericutes-2]|jgi:beta-phosphoglucomutase|nr:MAG: beta-phosphoglucomutase [Tenericutes bacterium HGW-Tenericutes-2]
MSRIQLVIFDLDGVITSTTNEHFKAWSLLFIKHFGIHLSSELESYTKGVSRLDSLHVLLEKSGIKLTDQTMIEKLANEKNLIYQELISEFDETNRFAGVMELLDYLKSKSVKIALGSASKNSSFLLKRINLANKFDYIVDPSGLKSKPDPAIFLDAMHQLKLNPDQCIGFEDAIAGVEAIKSAGILAIGIGNEKLANADYHFRSLKDIDYELLEKLIEG